MALPLKAAPQQSQGALEHLSATPPSLAHLHDTSDAALTYTMAFQPIVNLSQQRVIAYEALVRGLENQSAAHVFQQVSNDRRPAMDQHCRVLAIDLAVSLGLLPTGADLCINFNPNAIHGSAPALERTIEAAASSELPLSRIVLEITEMEHLQDPDHLRSILRCYRTQGLRTALDDFGAGFAGLSTLAAFQPDILKIDIALTRKIHERLASRAIVSGIAGICRELGIGIIAEGIEEPTQIDVLQDLGIDTFQGNYFAPAAFEALPVWP